MASAVISLVLNILAMQKFVFLLQSTHTHINNLVAVFVHNSFRIRMYDQ